MKKFNYDSFELRTITDNDEQVWFAAIDVCNVLGYQNVKDTLEKKLDDDEKKLDYLTDTSGQQRKTWTINEFGLYSLILTSSKPEAKVFKRWITHEVLPTIRKAGKYTTIEEKEREETIQDLVHEIEKLIAARDDYRAKANQKNRDIDQKNTELMQLLKSDFRQRKIVFPTS
jgi:prophage antirepressor-like protein